MIIVCIKTGQKKWRQWFHLHLHIEAFQICYSAHHTKEMERSLQQEANTWDAQKFVMKPQAKQIFCPLWEFNQLPKLQASPLKGAEDLKPALV